MDDGDNIRAMVSSFTQCASATKELSDSIDGLNKVYKGIEKNINKLKKIEDNLSSNEEIKELLGVTENMTEIFTFFNKQMPKLSENMSESKKEIEKYKKNFKDMTKYFADLNKEISNTDLNFEQKLLDSIEDKISLVIENKTTKMMNSLKSLVKQEETDCDKNSNVEGDTIYNLYLDNSRRLPISVQIKSWGENHYFRVDRIEVSPNTETLSLIAYGKRYIDDKFQDDFYISDDLRQFKKYEE